MISMRGPSPACTRRGAFLATAIGLTCLYGAGVAVGVASEARAASGPVAQSGCAATSNDTMESIPERVQQGCAVFGRVMPGSRVLLDGRPIRVTAAGEFVFGVGRDVAGPLSLQISDENGGGTRRVTMEVQSREWRIERVNGVPQKTVDPPPEITARIAREQAAVVAARQRDDDRNDFAGSFDWPLRGRISGVYGSQRVYNGSPRSPHSGLDVAAPSGTALRAPAPGTVTLVEPDLYLTGGTVLIDHGHGLSSVFLHMSRIDVKVGQRVARGDTFGAVGATGRATGPHMHWGLNWFGERLDPALLPGIFGTE